MKTSNTLANQVTVKLFIGTPLTSEVRAHLHQSSKWKQTTVKPIEERDLLEIHHAKSDYIGLQLTGQWVDIKNLKLEQERILFFLKDFCPELKEGALKICVFSQLYIS